MAKLNINVEYKFSRENFNRVKELLNEIQNNEKYVWSEDLYSKKGFDHKIYNYTEIIINEALYEVPINEKILNELMSLVHYLDFLEAEVINTYEINYDEISKKNLSAEKLAELNKKIDESFFNTKLEKKACYMLFSLYN